jgi:SAM-dependent MidA family methyltransferase
MSTALPVPSSEALALSTRLSGQIAARIRAHGPLPLRDYLEAVLYSPGLGYYSAGARKIGAAGDFVTAPELGELYGRALAFALAPVLGACRDPVLLELGGGSGALACTLLRTLAGLDRLPRRYLMLDRSADLRERQRERIGETLPALAGRVEWLDAPPEAPFEGALVANEVIDALAPSCFSIAAGGDFERAVALAADGGFVEIEQAPGAAVATALDQLRQQGIELPPGYRSEVLPELPAWLAAVTGPLASGVAVYADYGYGRREYYHPQRRMGTLIGHYRHHVIDDPFLWPGLVDWSASVDFTAVAEAGHAAGLELMGYDSQAGLVLGVGPARLLGDVDQMDDADRYRLSAELKQLTLPGQMGERFKLMALGRGAAAQAWPLGGLGQRHLL